MMMAVSSLESSRGPRQTLNPIHLSNTFQAGHMLLRERPAFLLQPILQPSKHFPVPIYAGAKCGLRRQGSRRLFMGTLHGWLEQHWLAGVIGSSTDSMGFLYGPTTFTANQSLLRQHVAELCVRLMYHGLYGIP